MIKSIFNKFIIYASILLSACILFVSVFVKAPGMPHLRYYIILIVAAALFAALLWLWPYCVSYFNKNIKTSKAVYIFCLITVTFIPRLFWVLAVDTAPVSDFLHLHDYAVNASKGLFKSFFYIYPVFPFKFGYGLILAGIYKLFGTSILFGKLFNIILSVCLSLLVYRVGTLAYNEKAGRIAGILFALWPSQIMYTSVLASEHVFMVFLIIGIYLFLKSVNDFSGLQKYTLLFISGILLAFSQAVRPIASLMFPIFIIYLFVFIKTDSALFKGLALKASWSLAIIAGFIICFSTIGFAVTRLTGVQAWNSSPGYNLLVGTNYKYNGMFNMDDFGILKEFNYDAGKIHKEAARRALLRIRTDPLQFLKLTVKKFVIQWANEDYGRYWSTLSINNESKEGSFKNRNGWLTAAAQGYYMIILILTIAGCIYSIRNGINGTALFLLFFLGLAAAYTFLEVQPRYHFPAIPFFIILAGYGTERMKNRSGRGLPA